jgi:hypothetical protein
MEGRRVLQSLKEISDYIKKRSIKTCQRWEIELGLPIHRLDRMRSALGFAYGDKIDRWVAEKLGNAEARARESAAYPTQAFSLFECVEGRKEERTTRYEIIPRVALSYYDIWL